MSVRAYWAYGLVIVTVVGWTTVAEWDTGRDGQVVFRPVAELNGDGGAQLSGDLVVARCKQTNAGLVVRGWVSPGPSPRVVLVDGGHDDEGGRRVGLAYATQTERGAQVGDFTITVPWATSDSAFALAADSNGATSPRGPLIRCP